MNTIYSPGTKIGLIIKQNKIVAVKSKRNKIVRWHIEEFDAGLYSDDLLFSSKVNLALNQITNSKENAQLWVGVSSQAPHVLRYCIPIGNEQQQPSTALWHFKHNTNMDLTKVLFDYEIHEKIKENGQLVQVVSGMAYPKQDENNLRLMLKQTNFEPFGITPLWQAWYHNFRLQKLHDSSECTAFMYTGENGSALQIFENGTELLSRHIKIGNSKFNEIVSKYTLDKTTETTGKRPNILHFEDGSESEASQDKPAEDSAMQHEIDLILNSLQRKMQLTTEVLTKQHNKQVKTVYVCGKLTKHEFFQEFLKNFFGEEVQIHQLNVAPKNVLTKSQFTETLDEDLKDAGVLALCDSNVTRNFLLPQREKRTLSTFTKRIRFAKALILLLSLGAAYSLFALSGNISNLKNTINIQQRNYQNFKAAIARQKLPTDKELKKQIAAIEKTCKKADLLLKLDTLVKQKSPKINFSEAKFENSETLISGRLLGFVDGEKDLQEFELGNFIRTINKVPELTASLISSSWVKTPADEQIKKFKIEINMKK